MHEENEKRERSERPVGTNSVGVATIALTVAAGLIALLLFPTRKRFTFSGRSVLITGGSRGLGLVMARQLAAKGADLAIMARDQEEVERAADDLRSRGARVIEIVGDVRDAAACRKAVNACVEQLGGLDVLINNAGVIQAGPLESQTEQDFRDAMDTHFWGPFYMTQAALSHLECSQGSIVNIAPIGGKVAVPHLAPYCASKFALVGLSSAWRSELAKKGISVTTVCPGLMRTGSHINAEFKGQKEVEYALFSILDALPFTSISAENAANEILAAVERGDAEVIVSLQAKAANHFNDIFPEVSANLLSAVNHILPDGNGTTDKRKGLESTSFASPSIVTSEIDRQSAMNNELKPGVKFPDR